MPQTDIEMDPVLGGNATGPVTLPATSTEGFRNQPPLSRGKVLKLLGRWVWTMIFIILIFVVAKVYLAKGNITKTQKASYNLIQTVLILVLGLNFLEAFKELISIARWKIGAWAECDDQEWRMIEDIGSLLTVWRLLRTSFAKHRIALFCVAWLALNLIAQMAVALISLTYSVDDGTNYRGTYIRDGIVNASNLSCYYHNDTCLSEVTRYALAHDYGGYGLGPTSESRECGDYSEIADVLNSDIAYPYWSNGKQEFAYRFNEYNFDDVAKSYPYLTNRTITVSSGDCVTYDVTDDSAKVEGVSGDGDGFEISYKNDTNNGSIIIPSASLGRQGTTYIYRGTKPVAEAETTFSCGDRCITMWAYKNPESTNPRFYQCPITVSAVSNAWQEAHNIPNGVAREAAASIALQGRWFGDITNQQWTQYQFYANGADLEIHHHTPEQVGANMAKFALLSLATMYFIALLSCIVGVHFALFVVIVLWVKRRAEDGGMGSLIAGNIHEYSRIS